MTHSERALRERERARERKRESGGGRVHRHLFKKLIANVFSKVFLRSSKNSNSFISKGCPYKAVLQR